MDHTILPAHIPYLEYGMYECEVLQRVRYINTLPLPFTFFTCLYLVSVQQMVLQLTEVAYI